MSDIEKAFEFEHKAQLDLAPMWRFTLSKKDSLLMLKALGGRLKEGYETAQAKELGDRLTLLRAKLARDLLQALEHAEEGVWISQMKAEQAAAETTTDPLFIQPKNFQKGVDKQLKSD